MTEPIGPEEQMQSREQRKRILGLIAGAVVVAIVVSLGLVYFTIRDDTPTAPAAQTFDVNFSDKEALNKEAINAVETTGMFGVDQSALTGNIVHQVAYLVSQQADGYTDYYFTRQRAYENIRDKVYPGSPVDYSSRELNDWVTTTEREQLWSLQVENVTASVPDKGEQVETDGKVMDTVVVPVTFDSIQRKRLPTAEDTSWDGSYRVLERTYPANTAEIVFVRDAQEWKIYDVRNLDKEFLVAFSGGIDDSQYADDQFDFEQVDVLTPDKTKKAPTPQPTTSSRSKE